MTRQWCWAAGLLSVKTSSLLSCTVQIKPHMSLSRHSPHTIYWPRRSCLQSYKIYNSQLRHCTLWLSCCGLESCIYMTGRKLFDLIWHKLLVITQSQSWSRTECQEQNFVSLYSYQLQSTVEKCKTTTCREKNIISLRFYFLVLKDFCAAIKDKEWATMNSWRSNNLCMEVLQ